MTRTVRYTYKLRVGKVKEELLTREFGMCRWVWNECVGLWKRGEGSKGLSVKLTEARARNTWLRSGSVVCQQQVIRDCQKSLNDSFRVKGRGRPQPKKKKNSRPSLNYTKRGFSLLTEKDHEGVDRLRLRLSKIGTIPVVWSRDLPSTPSSVRVYQDSCGEWFASFVVEAPEREPLPETGVDIGIDWGVKDVAITTVDDLDLGYTPRQKNVQKDRAKYQRRMAKLRGKKDEKSRHLYERNRKKAARCQRKAARQRQDAAFKWAHKVARHADRVAVEDFKPRFLAKSTMAKKASDSAIGSVKRTLLYVLGQYGREVTLVNPRFTTQDCSECDARTKHTLELSDRVFHCSECDYKAPRDKNSARVIRKRAGFNPSDVDGVIRENASVSTALPESGIPRL